MVNKMFSESFINTKTENETLSSSNAKNMFCVSHFFTTVNNEMLCSQIGENQIQYSWHIAPKKTRTISK